MARARWALAATILGSSMAFIDGTVVNVALPVLQSDLRATFGEAQWVINAYLLILSSLILAGGSLGDRFGLVRVFRLGTAIFACGSLWCAAAPTVGQLILARAVQGIGGALLVPGSLAIITEVFPAEERGKAFGIWSALTSIAVIGGPVVGGVLIQTFSWRAVFLINVPIAGAVLWIATRHMPPIPGQRRGTIDWTGALLATASLAAITWSLVELPARSGGPLMIGALSGAGCLAAFLVVESRAKQPLVPAALWKSRAFIAANLLTFLLYGALGVATFILPFDWIQIRHFSPAEAGAAFLPFVVTMSVLSPLSGAIADRLGARFLLVAGPLTVGAGFALLVFLRDRATYAAAFGAGLFAAGIGMGLTVAPLTAAVMSAIDDQHHAGIASAVNNAVARAAGLLAVAIFGAIGTFVFSRELDLRLAAQGASPAIRQAMMSQRLHFASAMPPAGSDAATRAMIEQSIRSAFEKAFVIGMTGTSALAILSAGAILLEPAAAARKRRTRKSRPRRREHAEGET